MIEKSGFTIFQLITFIIAICNIPLIVYIWKMLMKDVSEMKEWRRQMAEEGGGIMVRNEHKELCSDITEKAAEEFGERLDKTFNDHRAWLEERFKRTDRDIKLAVAEELKQWLPTLRRMISNPSGVNK